MEILEAREQGSPLADYHSFVDQVYYNRIWASEFSPALNLPLTQTLTQTCTVAQEPADSFRLEERGVYAATPLSVQLVLKALA